MLVLIGYLLVLSFTYSRADLWEDICLSADVKGDLVNERPYDGFFASHKGTLASKNFYQNLNFEVM